MTEDIYVLDVLFLHLIKHFDINTFALIIMKKTCKNFMALIKIKLIFKNENINITFKSSPIQSRNRKQTEMRWAQNSKVLLMEKLSSLLL